MGTSFPLWPYTCLDDQYTSTTTPGLFLHLCPGPWISSLSCSHQPLDVLSLPLMTSVHVQVLFGTICACSTQSTVIWMTDGAPTTAEVNTWSYTASYCPVHIRHHDVLWQIMLLTSFDTHTNLDTLTAASSISTLSIWDIWWEITAKN